VRLASTHQRICVLAARRCVALCIGYLCDASVARKAHDSARLATLKPSRTTCRSMVKTATNQNGESQTATCLNGDKKHGHNGNVYVIGLNHFVFGGSFCSSSSNKYTIRTYIKLMILLSNQCFIRI